MCRYVPPPAAQFDEASLRALIDFVRAKQPMHLGVAVQLIQAATKQVRKDEPMACLADDGQVEFVVVGDLHGNLEDLLHIIDAAGLPSEDLVYVFDGDFVDRGN